MKTPSQRESAIFSAARRLPASQHGAYLDESCAGDALLRQRVAELLQANEAAGTFLKELALHPGEEDAPSHLAKLGDRIGRYKLLEIVGEGGCGVVYMAEQEEPVRRRVALKVIKLGMDTRQVIARFEAERQALALMDHFNIAKVLDGGSTETGRPFFVMELVKGIPITRYCDEHNLNMAKRLALFVQVCQAIQHAHQKGIIHRDIKPSNVLVADHDGVPVPKIIDFGIAKATTDQRLTDKTLFTAFDQFIGTPAYMSPEQANFSGLDIDTRSDIYSLGVLLYELLIGKTPFEAEQLLKAGLDEIRRVIREEEPARPSTKLHTLETAEQTTVAKHRQSDPPKLAHLISGDLDWIVMKCLEKDRKRRYETASGLAADLLRHLNNEPVVARPAGGFYRFQRMVRRNKLVFAAAGAVALALIAGLGLSTWAFLRERQARNNEHQAEDNQQRLLYVADMNLARPAWDQNNLGQLNQLLEDTRAFPDRGFEWYYWQRKVHPCLMTLHPWGRSSNVNFVTFSPDGRRIVTGGSPSKVWDAASGRELLTLTDGFMAFSPDGQRMVTCGGDHTAKVLDTVSGRELLTLKGHLEGVKSVAFSPNGQRIVTGSDDGTAKEWDAASGRELLTLDDVLCVAISPDGRRIVTGSNDGTTKEWDAASGREVVTINGHDGRVRSVAFSPDGQRILTSSSQEPSPDHHLNQLRHSTKHSDIIVCGLYFA